MSEPPTPETDAIISVGLENADQECVPAEFGRKLERERDEAREAFVIATDQMVIAQINLREANKERDKAVDALMKIDDLFIDGTDIYADRENMGCIARAALEETK
jgi:hypothetical protein